jgi:hypothetical protein
MKRHPSFEAEHFGFMGTPTADPAQALSSRLFVRPVQTVVAWPVLGDATTVSISAIVPSATAWQAVPQGRWALAELGDAGLDLVDVDLGVLVDAAAHHRVLALIVGRDNDALAGPQQLLGFYGSLTLPRNRPSQAAAPVRRGSIPAGS